MNSYLTALFCPLTIDKHNLKLALLQYKYVTKVTTNRSQKTI